jgi:hypothetical protein
MRHWSRRGHALTWTPLSCLAGLGCSLAAAAEQAPEDDAVIDARLVYSFASNAYSTESDPTAGGAGEEELSWDDDQRLRLDVLNVPDHRAFSFLGGFSLSGQSSSDEYDEIELDYRSVSGRLNLGLAVSATDQVQFEILPFAGIGLAELDYRFAPALGAGRERATEDFVEYGLNINAVFTTRHGFQFGGGIGYLLSDADYSLGIPGNDDFSIDVEQSGPIYSIFIGTRL